MKNKLLQESLLAVLSLKNRKPYIELTQKNDIILIKNFIKKSGYYFSDIKVSLVNNDTQNSVKLIYDIVLGERAKIRNISFIGDKKIKDKKLRNIITSEESQFWKFISNKIYLDPGRIDLDKRLLKNYYKNNMIEISDLGDKSFYDFIILKKKFSFIFLII